MIGEVKNVERLPQAATAGLCGHAQSKEGYQFDLSVRDTTRLSRPLQRAMNAGRLNLFRVLPDEWE